MKKSKQNYKLKITDLEPDVRLRKKEEFTNWSEKIGKKLGSILGKISNRMYKKDK